MPEEEPRVDRRRMLRRIAGAGAGVAAASLTSPALAAPPPKDPPAEDLPDPWVDVRAFGARGDGSGDDGDAIRDALAAADTRRGGRVPIYLPRGIYRFTSPLVLPSNVTFFGDGSRPGNQGGTELRFAGVGTAVTAGSEGADWSNSQIRGLRIVPEGGSGIGWGLEVFNPTNVSTLSDIIISGFSEGQLHVSNGPGGDSNPGPNFFKLTNFFFIGGITPLYLERGRQTVLLEFGGIDVDDTSERGVLVETGEARAHVTTIEAVKVESRGRDVPGFEVRGIAPVTCIGCTVYNIPKTGTAPAFLYDAPDQPDLQVELLSCTSMGTSTFFSAPQRGVSIPADATRGYYVPHLSVAGGGGMVVPLTTRTEADRTWAMHKDVRLGWTDDSGARSNIDTNLYRAAPGAIATDGRIAARQGVVTKVVNGKVSDKAFPTPPPDGTLAVDARRKRLFVRIGGRWRKVSLR